MRGGPLVTLGKLVFTVVPRCVFVIPERMMIVRIESSLSSSVGLHRWGWHPIESSLFLDCMLHPGLAICHVGDHP
jgi:hypothetical protein